MAQGVDMPIGSSGRVVIDLDAEEKQQIYRELKARGLTMRQWFQQKVRDDGLFRSERLLEPGKPQNKTLGS